MSVTVKPVASSCPFALYRPSEPSMMRCWLSIDLMKLAIVCEDVSSPSED